MVGTVLVLATVLSACGNGAESADDGRPRVLAAFYPLHEAARRVGGDLVSLTNLTPAGAEPHDLELSSRQVDRIEDADVVLYLGGGFQPALEKVAGRSRGLVVDLLPDPASRLPAPAGGDEELEGDPHVWLDPRLYRAMVTRVAAALAEVDPPNRATYEANGAAYAAQLDALHARYTDGLANCERRVLVTSHAAFGYLARAYGLEQAAIAGLEPDSEPNPRRLGELAARVRAEGITTIFFETLVSPKVAESLAREAGVSTAVLDPLEGLPEDEIRAGKDYLSVMGDNLEALRKALGCR